MHGPLSHWSFKIIQGKKEQQTTEDAKTVSFDQYGLHLNF